MVGLTHNTSSGQIYFVSPAHRGRADEHKSIWVIEPTEEIACFDNAYTCLWYAGDKSWGLRIQGLNQLEIIGTNISRDSLRIAKFTYDSGQWHGYPADVNRKPKDRPAPAILAKWVSDGLISKPFMARIQGGRL